MEQRNLSKHKGPFAIVLTGHSGSGKSSLAESIAKEQGLPVFAAGGFEREYARKHGFSNIIDFQDIAGMQKAHYDIIPRMLKKIKAVAGDKGIVIEGVYDHLLYKKISQLFKGNVYLFNITAPRPVLIKRIMKKMKLSAEDAKVYFSELELRKQFVGGKEIRKMAHGTIKNMRTLNKARELLNRKLKKLMVRK